MYLGRGADPAYVETLASWIDLYKPDIKLLR
jgi:hypothetical protein